MSDLSALAAFMAKQYHASLEVNQHKVNQHSVEEQVREFGDEPGSDDEWTDEFVSVEEAHNAVLKDTLWALQWYPKNSVGFYRVYASSHAAIAMFIAEKGDRPDA